MRANGWEDVSDLAKAYGLVLDPWQENVLEAGMGERSDGLWAAPRVGVSVPRQSGKGEIIVARALAGLLVFGEQLTIVSAHEQKTARVAFDRISSYFENYDDLRKRVKQIGTAVAREYIELTSGQQIKFFARSKGSGRGFSCDLLLLDEAQILSETSWAAILPTLSARPNPQVWLFGTPPTPQDDGEVFTRFRDAGLEGKDHRLAWCEWSAEPADDLDSPESWAKANPAYGIRIHSDTIRDERAALDDATFARERLGMWDEASSARVIDIASWNACKDEHSIATDRLALGIDVSPLRDVASVALAGLRPDDKWHIELDEQRNGVGWVAPYVAALCERNDIRAVVIDKSSPAASVIDDLRSHKVKVTTTDVHQMVRACGSFYDAAMESTIRHIDQPQLNSALGSGRKRDAAGAWAWNRKNASSDITPLVATTLALWGAQTSSPVKRPTSSGKGRRVVVL